ncbi:hypothetical protein GPX89_07725 [Nocardia sp. ET3-3]|uniref:Class I SAM-dependent methyltransferase n=1 Tax=Nocardia terrae TaxID=2675851 RepID=A0A7K1US14_9NOCA|nr:hypothetical protein [Nocardia terrae]MVU77136.1 hypothetical protein [Nocardia terrae]
MNESRPALAAAVPASIWACGPADFPDPEQLWPTAILRRAVTEFSRHNARVQLLAAARRHQLAARRAVTDLAGIGREVTTATMDLPAARGEADLVIASLLPDPAHPYSPDTFTHLAFAAADQLRGGGILAVLTRCTHTPAGILDDPTGPVVSAAQAADLLYLAHVVAAPIRDDAIATPERAEHGEREPRHAVVHTDLTVFLRPDDQHLPAALDSAA